MNNKKLHVAVEAALENWDIVMDFETGCYIESMQGELAFLLSVIESQDKEVESLEQENKILRERLEAAKCLIEGLQDKLEVARRRVSDYDTVVSQRNFYFSECEKLRRQLNENNK